MPKGIIYVETMPASPDREAEYHKWYNDTHLEQILSVEGIVSARRFAPTDGNGPVRRDLRARLRRPRRGRDGGWADSGERQLTGIDNIAMDPKPIPHVYREIGSLGP